MMEPESNEQIPELTQEQAIEMIYDHAKNGANNGVNDWLEDPSKKGIIEQIFSLSDIDYHVTVFAIIYMSRAINEIFDEMEIDGQIEYSNTIFSLVMENYIKFNNEHILPFISDLISLIVCKGWGVIPSAEEYISNLLSETRDNLCTFNIASNVLVRVCEKTYELGITSFINQYYHPIFQFALTHISEILNAYDESLMQITDVLLELGYRSIQVVVDSVAENKIAAVISEEWSLTITDPQLFQILFACLHTFPSDNVAMYTLQILNLLCSPEIARFNKNIDPKQFLVDIYNNFIEYISGITELNPDNNSFYHLIKLLNTIYKNVKKELNSDQYDENGIITAAIDINLKIFTPEFIFKQSKSITDIIDFWSKVLDEVSPNIPEIKLDLLTRYKDSIISGLELDYEHVLDAFIKNTGETSAIITRFKVLLKNQSKQVYDMIADSLEQSLLVLFDKLEAQEDTRLISSSMAFMVTLAVEITRYLTSPLEEADALCNMFVGIFTVFDQVLTNADQADPDSAMRYSFLTFANEISSHDIFDHNQGNGTQFFNSMNANETDCPYNSTDAVIEFTISTLISMLQVSKDPELNIRATKTLHSLIFSNTWYSRIACQVPIVKHIPAMRYDQNRNHFLFLTDDAQGRARSSLHTSIALLITQNDVNPEIQQSCLHAYDSVFEAAAETPSSRRQLFGLLRDFIGFFKSHPTTDYFLLFFNYLFPEHLDQLTSFIPKIAGEPSYVNALLKMWAELLKRPDVIVFGHHSPNGLLLFKAGAAMLNAICDAVVPGVKERYDEKANDTQGCRFLALVFRVMSKLLDAKYVPFNAFEIFNDPVLRDLLQLFKNVLTSFALVDTMAVEKIRISVMAVIRAICNHHLEVALIPEMELSGILLEVIGFAMNDGQKEPISIFRQLVERAPDITALDHDQFVRIMIVLWGLIFRSDAKRGDQMGCLQAVMKSYLDGFDIIHDRMAQYVTDSEAFEAACGAFADRLDEKVNSATDFNNSTIDFVRDTKGLLTAPQRIFNPDI